MYRLFDANRNISIYLLAPADQNFILVADDYFFLSICKFKFNNMLLHLL